VKDENEHLYRLEDGPQVFVRKDHETVTTGDRPIQMISLPIRHYCIIEDPVIRDNGEIVKDDKDQVVIKYGETEIRFQEQY